MTWLVDFSRMIAAAPEELFDAWLDPEAIAHFMCPGEGVRVRDVEVDARVGGAFSLNMVAGETVIPIHGTYRVIDRATKLAFAWLSDRTTDESVVTLTFEASSEGTQMTLHHEGFPDEGARDDHAGGWQHIVGRLVHWSEAR